MKDVTIERVYKSAWHAMIALVGVYELVRNRRTVMSRVLAVGLIAFHVDAAICDGLGIPTTAQRALSKLRADSPEPIACGRCDRLGAMQARSLRGEDLGLTNSKRRGKIQA